MRFQHKNQLYCLLVCLARQSNAREKALAYLADFACEHRRHGREHEAEADSLAARFLARIGYDATQAIAALQMLDQVDSTFYTPGFDLETTFQFPDYPFKTRWLETESTLFQDGQRVFDGALNKDSLKTHPDCQHRAVRMREGYLASYAAAGKLADPQGHDLFLRLRQTARYESLLASFDADDVDLCLFHTLGQLREQPADRCLQALVGRCFNRLYAAQKDHVFSRCVHPPRIEYDAGYSS